MAERRPLIVKDGRIEEIPSGDTISTAIAPGSGGGGSGIPDGGTTGQILIKNSDTDGDAGWDDAPSDGVDGVDGTDGQGVPTGGTAGQKLVKIDGVDFNTEWVDDVSSSMVQTELTGTTHTVDDTDLAGNVIRKLNNAAAITVTVAPSLTGTEPATYIQTGAGAITFAPGAGVTILSADSNLTIGAQYASASLIPDTVTADTFYLVGNLIA